ncbi:MAG: cation:proton antiporter [Thermoplasmatota archaeon]
MVTWTPDLIAFGGAAALIFLGYLGNVIFAQTRVNDTLLLIAVGVFIGPVSCSVLSTGCLVEPATLARITPIVGPLALILILFDGGLALRFKELAHGVGGALVLALVGFTLTAAALGAIAAWILEIPFMTGVILGTILGGTSALVVLPSLQHLRTERKTATMLSLESAITDVLVVVVASGLILIVAAGQGPDPQSLAGTLVTTFIVAIVIGAAAGAGWLAVSRRIVDKPYGYMVTLGVMLALYVLVQSLLRDAPGGGPLAVLAFGVTLGNSESLGPWFQKRADATFSTGFKRFQGELAFLVRTFFFVYLGILVDFDLLLDPIIFGVGCLLFVGLVAARYVAVALASRSPRLKGDAGIMLAMMPRGLAAAVLAAAPMEAGIEGTESFVALAFLLLVLTNLATTVGAFTMERRQSGTPGPKDGAAWKDSWRGTFFPRPTTAGPAEEDDNATSVPVVDARRTAGRKDVPKKSSIKVVGRGLERDDRRRRSR